MVSDLAVLDNFEYSRTVSIYSRILPSSWMKYWMGYCGAPGSLQQAFSKKGTPPEVFKTESFCLTTLLIASMILYEYAKDLHVTVSISVRWARLLFRIAALISSENPCARCLTPDLMENGTTGGRNVCQRLILCSRGTNISGCNLKYSRLRSNRSCTSGWAMTWRSMMGRICASNLSWLSFWIDAQTEIELFIRCRTQTMYLSPVSSWTPSKG